MFSPVDPYPDFPVQERETLKFWERNGVLQKYLGRNAGSSDRFSFLDGPITANNPMGVHHAWGRTYKDVFQRFNNMLGKKQRFQNGFDCQGLWVEVEVEKELGFKTKKDIEDYGIDKFVQACKDRVYKYAAIQTKQSQRLGYFMDWGNDYYTMSEENNYAIWHFLKICWQRGFLYKGCDSVPWCPRCGTAISQHEISTEEYADVEHQSIYLRLPVEGQANTYLLVWTTTPWTLPANVAVAVNPDLDYVSLRVPEELTGKGADQEQILIVAKDRVASVFPEAGDTIDPRWLVKEHRGSSLKGLKYSAPFDHLARVQQARQENPKTFHSVITSTDYVNAEEGTGLVHIAPGCGAEDFELGTENHLPVLGVIDEAANYLDGLGEFSGKNAKQHPELIFDYLGQVNDPPFLFKTELYRHRYPRCWRCKEELVWRVVDEWYLGMDREDPTDESGRTLRQQLKDSTNQVAKWVPEFGYAREMDWLNNMHDWLISKKRYWGLALPVWECVCGYFEVIGSRKELEERAVAGWEEFDGHTPHRPWVDEVKIKCPQCGQLMSRVPDVGTPWLDAGIVAYSTLKYFQDRDYWQKWFPADLITECFPGQFRNWFYSLLAMSTVLERKAPFKTLVGHALVYDEHGEEMHKSKGNAIWFDDGVEKMGADVMRWLFCRQNPTINVNFGYGPADQIRRRFFLIFWNCYKFFVTYANLDSWDPSGAAHQTLQPLDRWILSRLSWLKDTVTEALGDYDTPKATEAVENFVISDFSTWYIRLSRDRVGPAVPDSESKQAFYHTSYRILKELIVLISPLTPFLSEQVWQNLKQADDPVSVHLAAWPEGAVRDENLEESMSTVRQIVELGRAARAEAGVKLRQPLASLKTSLLGPGGQGLRSGQLLDIIEKELNVRKVEFTEDSSDLTVSFDLTITEELRLEGQVRELARDIQRRRKKLGCGFADKVRVRYPREMKKAVSKYEEYLKQKVLADLLEEGEELVVEPV